MIRNAESEFLNGSTAFCGVHSAAHLPEHDIMHSREEPPRRTKPQGTTFQVKPLDADALDQRCAHDGKWQSGGSVTL